MSEQQAVTEMFDGISSHYDFLNHLLSFGIDRRWRRITSKWVAKHQPSTILDVATGTADLAIRMAKDIPSASITGVDLSEKMLEHGRAKLIKKVLEQRITLATDNATNLNFNDNSFDAVTSAFGVRNFEDLETGLREMMRVCRHNGVIAILEFSHPTNALMKRMYRWYSRRWIPRAGRNVSKHPTAYSYLPSTVESFPSGEAFEVILRKVGLIDIGRKVFSGGIATLYYGYKPKNDPPSQ
ncbi:MAG: bifunctional demethylmenaquinone methyltransferase/2-methoxy-6-polyprenyl-1,4-benzoquinol methylase UbiE [Bacteroidales bacterium]|nr:bifunctional demethylmenaquinone methyltransferase/2-methoxy-6-polyprenyl-1,4-benzoquinol methylase UbiE [Bacteroidales bacterium]